MIFELTLTVIGWLYPAFATYNCLNANLRSQVAWTKYWIVFSLLNACKFFSCCLEHWVPFSSAFKLFVLCWLMPSLGGGSQLIHDEIFDPLLRSNGRSIRGVIDSISSLISALLRELVKMVYHLLVDVVEQCWLMTRNADDIHVTPRLQSAINEVITELRAVRQAAKCPLAKRQARAAAKHLKSNSINIQSKSEPILNEASRGDVALSGTVAHMTDDDIKLRILLAEAVNAQRMQISHKLSSQEHLAPINSCRRALVPPKPAPKRPAKPKMA